MTNTLNDFIKTATEKSEELRKEITERSEELRKELSGRGEKLAKEANSTYKTLLDETLVTVNTVERGVLRGVQKALRQAADKVEESARLEKAHSFIKNLADEAERLAEKVEEVGASRTEPLEDYDTMNVKQILKAAKVLSASQVKAIVAYEKAHKARKSILRELDA